MSATKQQTTKLKKKQTYQPSDWNFYSASVQERDLSRGGGERLHCQIV